MHINDKQYFEAYFQQFGHLLATLCPTVQRRAAQLDLSYLTQASAVFSSNIEGNSIDLNSFMNHQMSKSILRKKKEITEITDLIAAYEQAQTLPLTEKNLLKVHKTLSKQLVSAAFRGKYRNDRIGVFDADGLVYLAVEAELVAQEMQILFADVADLLARELTEAEVFYSGALLHLRFVHIHPFRDGNGRTARILEKWFLSQKLGAHYWTIASEKYYKEHSDEYYRAIHLGANFYTLQYARSMPFLELLIKILAAN